jgi:hypothetical protein
MKHSEWYRSLPEMDRRTGIDPVHAADVTLHELRIYFRTELPADFEDRLVRRMELAYARHARWREQATRAKEPDFVRVFFRRWLAELLFKERQNLFWQLPPGYRYGVPEWQNSAPVNTLPELPKAEPVEIIRPLRKTVRQSLPFVHGAELLAA